MQTVRKILVGTVVLALIGTLAGCTPTPIPPTSALVGRWHHRGDGAEIVLSADGMATLKNLPTNALEATTLTPGGEPLDLVGRWAMGDGLGGSRDHGDPVFSIDLYTDEDSPIEGLIPIIEGSGKSLRFLWVIGDPDNDVHYVFTKQ
jgi:hypothetical protein